MIELKYGLVIIAGLLSLSSFAQARVANHTDMPSASKDDGAVYLAENKPNRGATGSVRRRGAVVVEGLNAHLKERKVNQQNNSSAHQNRHRGTTISEDMNRRVKDKRAK